MVERLFNEWPDAIPLNYLCGNGQLDETNSLSILRFMLDVDPELPMYAADGELPIHRAVISKSTKFCKAD